MKKIVKEGIRLEQFEMQPDEAVAYLKEFPATKGSSDRKSASHGEERFTCGALFFRLFFSPSGQVFLCNYCDTIIAGAGRARGMCDLEYGTVL